MSNAKITYNSRTYNITIPAALNVAPANINSFLWQRYTPAINRSTAGVPETLYFVFFATDGNTSIKMSTYQADFERNDTKATVSHMYIPAENKCGSLAREMANNSTLLNQFKIELKRTITGVSLAASDRVRYALTFSGFTPNAPVIIAPLYQTTPPSEQFGYVKDFASASWSAGVDAKTWTYTRDNPEAELAITPPQTVTLSANGETATSGSGTGTRSVSLAAKIVNSAELSGTATVTNNLGGRLTSAHKVTLQDYTKPSLSALTSTRTSDGHARVAFNWSVSPLNKANSATDPCTFGTITASYTIRNNDDSTVVATGTKTIIADGEAMTSASGSYSFVDTATFATDKSYTVSATITDRLGQTSQTITAILATEFRTVDFKAGGSGVAFGRVADENNKVLFDRRMIPKVVSGSTDTSTFYQAERTDKGIIVDFGIGASGEAYGIWSEYNHKWVINEDTSGVTRIPSADIRLAGHSSSIGTVVNGWLSAAKSVPSGKSSGTMLCSVSLDAGVWLVTAGARFPANSTGVRVMNVATSSGASAWDMSAAAQSAETLQMRGAWVFMPTAATTCYLNVMQTSGSSLSMPAAGSGYGNFIRAVRIL